MVEGGRLEEIIIDGLSSRLKTERGPRNICPSCENELTSKTKECPNCGFEFGGNYDYLLKDGKHNLIPAIGSVIFPGIGQLLNDQLEKALIFIFLGTFFHHYVLNYIRGNYVFLPIIIILLIWIYIVFDAYTGASNFGSQEGVSPSNENKSSIKAGLGSILLPGIGQIYNGQYTKGAIMLFVVAISIFFFFMARWFGFLLEPIHIILLLGCLWAFNVYDSLIISRKINQLKTNVLSLKQGKKLEAR